MTQYVAIAILHVWHALVRLSVLHVLKVILLVGAAVSVEEHVLTVALMWINVQPVSKIYMVLLDNAQPVNLVITLIAGSNANFAHWTASHVIAMLIAPAVSTLVR